MNRIVFIFTLILSLSTLADQFSAKTKPIYNQFGMASMRTCEVGETLPLDQRPADYCGHPYVVKYFNLSDPADLAERDTYRVSIIEGLVYKANEPHDVYPDGSVFFVMDVNGNFYLFSKDGEAPLHHSSFFDGEPIPAGGEMSIEKGKITRLTRNTGHYEMTKKILKNALQALQDDGVDTHDL